MTPKVDIGANAIGLDLGGLDGLNVREAIGTLTRLFKAAGIDGASLDARRLVSAAAALSTGDLVREPERLLEPADSVRLSDFARRRLAREPVSRVVGERGFYGRMFVVTPATLDPRPCSETLIDAALELLGSERARELRIFDAGTGTGCLLLTLLAEIPQATGVGIDISDTALAVARDNARQLGLAGRAEFLKSSFAEVGVGPFDVLISNPPYIRTRDIAALDRDVRDYDPLVALDGGADGLDAYRHIAAIAPRLVPGGWVILEVGVGQHEDVLGLFHSAFAATAYETRLFKDLGGHTRCVAVRTR